MFVRFDCGCIGIRFGDGFRVLKYCDPPPWVPETDLSWSSYGPRPDVETEPLSEEETAALESEIQAAFSAASDLKTLKRILERQE